MGIVGDIRRAIVLLIQLNQKVDNVMSALTDLQAAYAGLVAEVTTFLADVASALSASNPDIETVVSGINAQVAKLKAADPLSTTSAPTTSTTPTSTTPPTSSAPTTATTASGSVPGF